MNGEGDYYCLNDGHAFHGKPYTYPTDNADTPSGDIFCSTHCALRFVINEKPPKLIPICHLFFIKYYGQSFVTPAPHRRTLQINNGVYSIEKYRSMGTNNVYAVITSADVFPFGVDARVINEEEASAYDDTDTTVTSTMH